MGRIIGYIVALGLLLVAGAAFTLFTLRWYDLNVQDIPFGRTFIWGFIGLIAIVTGIGAVALLARGHRSKQPPSTSSNPSPV